MKRIVLVGCGKAKAAATCDARELYVGNLFRAARAHAEQMVSAGEADAWYILSGKHGLLESTDQVAPYDERVPGGAVRMGEWGERVVEQIRAVFPTGEVCAKCDGRHRVTTASGPGRPCSACADAGLELVLLAGVMYAAPIRGRLEDLRLDRVGWSLDEPLCGLGIGERLAWFKRQRPAPRCARHRAAGGALLGRGSVNANERQREACPTHGVPCPDGPLLKKE